MKSRRLEKVNLARHIIMAYPFATCLIVGIWVVCLMPVPETPLANISLFDKWVHMTLYATCTGGNRSGDWLDFAANSIGVVVGNVIGMLLAKCFAKDKKGK